MAWTRRLLGDNNTPIGDSYTSLAELFNFERENGIRIPNATLKILNQSATITYGKRPNDPVGIGDPIAAGSGISFDATIDNAWDLGQIWIRNTTALSIATVVLNGPIYIGED